VSEATARKARTGKTRNAILEAAEELFAERGFEATRLDDVADDVGIRRAAIFYHFGDKQELYAAVLGEVFRGLAADLPKEGSALERLEASLGGWIEFVARRPNVARLILREAAGARPGEATPFTLAGQATGDWFRRLLHEGIASGEFRPLVEADRFMGLIASIAFFHFAAMAWLTLDEPVDPWSREELEKHKRELLLVARGLLGTDAPAGEGD
jgi:TetR/AcrR family transcriptional regulator